MDTAATDRGKRRILGLRAPHGGLSPGVKMLLLFAALGILGVLLAVSDPEASLRRLKVGFLSGGVKGNYFAIVDRIAVAAARRKGDVRNLTSAGSVENVQRLAAAKDDCSAHFALVQDGIEWPEGNTFELIGRLPRPELLVVLGKDADRISTPRELYGMRVGVGPAGSGTEALVRRLIAPLPQLGLQLSTHSMDEQLEMLLRGELDLGAMVIDEDALLLQESIRKQKLQILSLPRAEAIASVLPFARVARIEAGHYDPVATLPPSDKAIVQIDTLVVGNGCASRSATQGLITVLARLYPAFLKENRDTPNLTGLPYAATARSYYDTGGPDLVGVYAPWVIDIMPTANWVQLGLVVSILFTAMGAANAFRLWRYDVARVKIEDEVPDLFHPGVTVGEITALQPDARSVGADTRARLQSIILRLEHLYQRCRRQSQSILVPMGREMAYRDQERMMTELLEALRSYARRLDALSGGRPGSDSTPDSPAP